MSNPQKPETRFIDSNGDEYPLSAIDKGTIKAIEAPAPRAIPQLVYRNGKRVQEDCTRTKPGWRCSREKDHEGPCAAWWPTGWGRIYWAWRLKSLSVLLGRHI